MNLRGGPPRAIIDFRRLWVNGSTLQVRFLGGTGTQHDLVKEQADWWTQHANLNFDFNNAANAEIRIAFDSSDGAWSYVGTDALEQPPNAPTMNLGFTDGGTPAHEFGHAIGLHHEHQNSDGGIQWNRNEVIRALSGPPNNWTVAQIEHNVLNKYSVDQVRGTKFDPDSIMLYFFPASWTLNNIGTKENDVLSDSDKDFIASALAYPGRGGQTPKPVELPVLETSGTAADIGAPGEEDLFTFKVTQNGRYTIETGGQTDVVMKLFGPDSQTQLVAEDDDGGEGRNSRITANLRTGEYFVQIRHYNTTSGTGNYTIRVTK
jgi:hypothetical protein